MSRYTYTRKIINNSDIYYNIIKNRKINFIEQYATTIIRPPTIDFKTSIDKFSHVWSSGDKYFSLSERYYQNIRYWYLIAWFNEKPTEQHIEIGEIIYIPSPLTKVLSYYNGEYNG